MKLVCVILGYLFGSLSASILLSRCVFHADIRTQGSGNAGAANAARVFGMGAGILTFVCDFAKTVLAMLLGRLLCGETGLVLAGFGCLVGHCWPLYFRFRGGKAVSSGAAAALMLDWRLFLLAVAVYALGAVCSKKASVSSLCGAFAIGVGSFWLLNEPQKKALAVFITLLVFFMHRSNIRRLIDGTEPKFSFGKRN